MKNLDHIVRTFKIWITDPVVIGVIAMMAIIVYLYSQCPGGNP